MNEEGFESIDEYSALCSSKYGIMISKDKKSAVIVCTKETGDLRSEVWNNSRADLSEDQEDED